MNTEQVLSSLSDLLSASVSPYHCILESCRQLEDAGFHALSLADTWDLQPDNGYFLPIFDSSLLAFTVGPDLTDRPSLRMEASHTDWPCLKLKPSPEVTTDRYGKLNVEVYGGPILNTVLSPWQERCA